jgi:hypothetical protein
MRSAVLPGLFQLAIALIGIVGLLLAVYLCLHLVRIFVGLAAGLLPLIGRRHRHNRWTEMNATNEPPTAKKDTGR